MESRQQRKICTRRHSDKRIRPSQKLSWKWVVGDIDTVVTLTLAPTESGTRLTIVQSGFKPDQKREFGGARAVTNTIQTKAS